MSNGQRDIHAGLESEQNLAPVVLNPTQNGAIADMQGNESSEVEFLIGDSGDTLSGSVYLELGLEHGDEVGGGDMAAVASEDVISDGLTVDGNGHFTLIDAPDEDTVRVRVGYRGVKRYVRPKITLTGTHTNGIPCGILLVKGNLYRK